MSEEAEAKTGLLELRTRAGISRGKLGKMIEKSVSTIINYESGKTNIPEDTAAKLCDIFHVDLAELRPVAAEVSIQEDVDDTCSPTIDQDPVIVDDDSPTPDEIANSQQRAEEEELDEDNDDSYGEGETVTLDLGNAPPDTEPDDEQPPRHMIITLDPSRAERERDWISNLAFATVDDKHVLKVDGIIDSAGNKFDGSTIDPGEQMLIRTIPPKGSEGMLVSPMPELAIRNELWLQPRLVEIGGAFYALASCNGRSLDIVRGMAFAILR